jgi:hypothetical protein
MLSKYSYSLLHHYLTCKVDSPDWCLGIVHWRSRDVLIPEVTWTRSLRCVGVTCMYPWVSIRPMSASASQSKPLWFGARSAGNVRIAAYRYHTRISFDRTPIRIAISIGHELLVIWTNCMDFRIYSAEDCAWYTCTNICLLSPAVWRGPSDILLDKFISK